MAGPMLFPALGSEAEGAASPVTKRPLGSRSCYRSDRTDRNHAGVRDVVVQNFFEELRQVVPE